MDTAIELATVSAAATIHWLTALEGDTDKVIASLPEREDDELLTIRRQASILGKCAWRIEAACDAEIVKRGHARRGRGNKDIEGAGVKAAVAKHAAELNVDPRRVWENAQLHANFFDTENSASARTNLASNGSVEILEDKSFYLAAMASDDPHATLEYFAQQKTENPFYSTRDAWRDVKAAKAPPLNQELRPLIEDDAVRQAWASFQSASRDLSTATQKAGIPLGAMLRGFLDELQYEIQKPGVTRQQQLLDLIGQGVDECDLIANHTGIDRIHVQVWLNRLEDDGVLESFEKERAPGARGQARTGYRVAQ